MEIHDDIEQGTDEWFRLRAGIQTASTFALSNAKGRGKTPSKTRQTHMYKLAGERITGEPADMFTNRHMERGKEREAEARALYMLETGNPVRQVGFVRNGPYGCSPDGLVGADGLVEMKDRLAHIQIACLDQGKVPPEVMPQLYGQLLVTGRDWVDYVSHCRGLPLFVRRIHRDESRIAEIKIGLDQFEQELEALVEKIRRM